MIPSMKRRRLRKQYKQREFELFDFFIQGFTVSVTEKQADDFLDEFIDFVEARGLGFGGGFSPTGSVPGEFRFSFYVSKWDNLRHRGRLVCRDKSCTEDDMVAVYENLRSCSSILKVRVTGLVGQNDKKFWDLHERGELNFYESDSSIWANKPSGIVQVTP